MADRDAVTNGPTADELDEGPFPSCSSCSTTRSCCSSSGSRCPTVLYIVWGVMEIVAIPVAK